MIPEVTGTDRIIGLFVACTATGMYIVSLMYCLRWLLYTDGGWKLRDRIDRVMVSAVLSMAVLSSVHTSLAVSTTFGVVQDLERGSDGTSNGSLPWSSVVMCTVANMTVLIADGFLIYRCWRMYARSLKRVAIPCFFWIGGVACTVLQLYWQVVQSAPIQAVWTPVNMNIGPGTILTPFWASTIVVNLYTTSVLVYRIWRAANAQPASATPNTDLRFIVRILIESGAIYALITIPHFVAWWTTSSMAILVLGWINLPVVCSAFNLIVIRTARHRMDVDLERAEKQAVIPSMVFASPPEAEQFPSTYSHEFDSRQSTLTAESS
ncbi:hypothetical protein D9613_011835 [Agrocybe pediades]|uniref:Uncharacterized protein n=1 Tax=Agrocybe pediades TaxID=84607 RepID=A0A8H4QLW6_9AGAR|nr:hypothetical protein D9613_011835 [Agrocybe pediades]